MSIRKPAATREKEFELAIFRIERGRSKTKATKLSVAAVAREVGVTPALIHNSYPKIADKIRIKVKGSSRRRLDEKQNELKQALNRNRELRQHLAEAENCVAKLASINEVLLMENKTLKAAAVDRKVVPIR
jgi:transposase-like protein